jgi:hypothetical protein
MSQNSTNYNIHRELFQIQMVSGSPFPYGTAQPESKKAGRAETRTTLPLLKLKRNQKYSTKII